MYGVVNKAIQELVTENFGVQVWEKVKSRSNVDVNSFLSNEQYSDDVTFKLAIAASEELNMPLRDVLLAFGEFWVLSTGKKHYGSLMESGGSSFKDFILNLPNFHSRVMLYYSNIVPPEFKIDQISESEIQLHYFSIRTGLTDFMEGLILGLAKMFDTQVQVTLIQQKGLEHDHDIFKIIL
jgi:hypothetical protein